jgi:hypothetical protein
LISSAHDDYERHEKVVWVIESSESFEPICVYQRMSIWDGVSRQVGFALILNMLK